MAPPSDRGERAFIQRIAPLCLSGSTVPFGDDLAELTPDTFWSCDMLMDGVDFDSRTHDWRSIGRKALAVNLSDCAAMGVRPVGALVALALHDGLAPSDGDALMAGVASCGAEFACPVRGGDTNAWSGATVVCVTIAGRPDPGTKPVRRDGARPGDRILLSGPIGGSLLGRHMTFRPRVALGLQIAATLPATAMIDISDGFSIDLARICEASACGAVLHRSAVEPLIHADARLRAANTGRTPLEHALGDGEDFELIVAAPPHATETALRLGLTPVGEFCSAAGLQLADETGGREPLEPAGWEHWR